MTALQRMDKATASCLPDGWMPLTSWTGCPKPWMPLSLPWTGWISRDFYLTDRNARRQMLPAGREDSGPTHCMKKGMSFVGTM